MLTGPGWEHIPYIINSRISLVCLPAIHGRHDCCFCSMTIPSTMNQIQNLDVAAALKRGVVFVQQQSSILWRIKDDNLDVTVL